MSDKEEFIHTFLLECYKEDNHHARHLDNQRLEIAKFILTLQAAIGGAIGYAASKDYTWWVLALAIIFTALAHCGFHSSNVLIERFFSHRNRGHLVRNRLLLFNDEKISTLKTAETTTEVACSKIEKTQRFRSFWNFLYLMMIGLGIVVLLATAWWMSRKFCPFAFFMPFPIALGSFIGGCIQCRLFYEWKKRQDDLEKSLFKVAK